MRFLGNIEAKTDAKGRVFLPAVFRKQLQTAGEEQLVRNRRLDEITAKVSVWDEEEQMVLREWMSEAEQLTLDGNGRFLISKRLLQAAGIEQGVRFIGMNDTIEIWAAEKAEQPFLSQKDFASRLKTIMSKSQEGCLSRLGPKGRLFSFDQDADAEKNIASLNSSAGVKQGIFVFIRSNFRYLKNWMRYCEVEHIDGLLADLGVSSHHFDDETRGFSFRFDAPLDMRMNKRAGKTAADVLNSYSEEQLADVFYLYGELKQARRMAATIVKARQQKPIATTSDLLGILGIKCLTADDDTSAQQPPSNAKKDLARLFQALRIEVNNEMVALREMLAGAQELLRPGGRLSVITYHSLEDRIVKNVMRAGNAEGRVEQDFFGRAQSPFRLVNNKVITPSDEEMQCNPRSRSAKLRVAEKI